MKVRMTPLGAAGLLIVTGLNVWLLTVIASYFSVEGSDAVAKAEWAANLSASLEDGAPRKSIDAYKEVLARPFFFKSREPFVAPVAPPPPIQKVAPPPPVSNPGFVLAGVMIKNDVRKVYMLSPGSAGGAWAAEGDDFMGWKVQSVSGASVKLEQQGRQIEVHLHPQK